MWLEFMTPRLSQPGAPDPYYFEVNPSNHISSAVYFSVYL